MDIEVDTSGKIVVVRPKEDLRRGAANQMKEKLDELLDRGHADLLVDLGAVSYVDSFGLEALVDALKRARAAGGDLSLCGVHDDVLAILELTRLSRVITVHSTRQEIVRVPRTSEHAYAGREGGSNGCR
jgi:anti-sigma B factor antagonist